VRVPRAGSYRRAFAHLAAPERNCAVAHPLSFAEVSGDVADIAAPILRQQPACNVVMEAAVRPVACPRNVAVFDGIEMNVVDMAREVFVIADGVLPVAALPNSFLAFGDLAGRARRIAGEPA
jgi:hypothetical protein